MDCVVAPVDHILPETADEVSTTLPPAHNAVVPLAVIVGVEGVGLTVTVCEPEAPEEQPPVTTCTE
jgi:hypothetical protein